MCALLTGKYNGVTLRVPGPTDFSREVFLDRYANKDKHGHPIEREYSEAHARIARSLARTPEEKALFLDLLGSWRLVPGGRIFAGAGLGDKATLGNCYVVDIEDSREGIFRRTLPDAIEILSKGGGVGFNFSDLRPRGAYLRTSRGHASGPVSFIRTYNACFEVIEQGGSRRAAAMGILNADHPDIIEFVDYKSEHLGDLQHFNVSVGITEGFREALARGLDTPWQLSFRGHYKRTVRIGDVWERIVRNAWRSGDPGLFNLVEANRMNNTWYFERILGSNPSMPAGTLVGTRKGIVPIEELEGKSFEVKSRDGTWAPAVCRLSGEDEEILEISFGANRTVCSTRQHRWPVLGRLGRIHKVDAKDLRVGDLIPLNRNEPTGMCGDPTLTEEDGFFLGHLFGTSWLPGGLAGAGTGELGSSWVFAAQDRALAERVAAYISARQGQASRVQERPDGTLVIAGVDQAFIDGAVERFGWTPGKASLPSVVWRSNDAFVRGFIDGLFSADGHVTDPTGSSASIALTTAHRDVAVEVSKLISFYGVAATVSGGTVAKGAGETWHVKLTQSQIARFARVFAISQANKGERLRAIVAARAFRRHVRDEFAVVTAIRPVGRTKVWDISVYHDEHVFPAQYSYTGNCGEIPLPPYGVCCLSSVNLVRFVDVSGPEPRFDFAGLREAVAGAIRFLDAVLDANYFPIQRAREVALRSRRVGLSVMGLADTFILMGMRYGDEASLALYRQILETMRDEAYAASTKLAAELGPFPMFDADKYLEGNFIKTLPQEIRRDIRRFGIRNACLLTQAPTGTSSILAGVSSGIEPIFARSYKRRDRTGVHWVAHPNAHVPWFVTAHEVDILGHLRMQEEGQRFVCQSISKTCNVDHDAPESQVDFIFRYALDHNFKGITVFRDGSRGGVLEKETCPECGGDIIYSEHCRSCQQCGWSACSL